MRIKDSILLMSVIGALVAAGVSAADSKPAKDSKITPYPLTKCVVSGEKLGSMGEPYVITNGTQQVKFCCKGCLKDFNKDTAKYLKKLKQSDSK